MASWNRMTARWALFAAAALGAPLAAQAQPAVTTYQCPSQLYFAPTLSSADAAWSVADRGPWINFAGAARLGRAGDRQTLECSYRLFDVKTYWARRVAPSGYDCRHLGLGQFRCALQANSVVGRIKATLTRDCGFLSKEEILADLRAAASENRLSFKYNRNTDVLNPRIGFILGSSLFTDKDTGDDAWLRGRWNPASRFRTTVKLKGISSEITIGMSPYGFSGDDLRIVYELDQRGRRRIALHTPVWKHPVVEHKHQTTVLTAPAGFDDPFIGARFTLAEQAGGGARLRYLHAAYYGGLAGSTFDNIGPRRRANRDRVLRALSREADATLRVMTEDSDRYYENGQGRAWRRFQDAFAFKLRQRLSGRLGVSMAETAEYRLASFGDQLRVTGRQRDLDGAVFAWNKQSSQLVCGQLIGAGGRDLLTP